MSDKVHDRFTDEDARAILARAIEIDARTPMTTMDDLRSIAGEIGVSSTSLEAALREQSMSVVTRRVAAGRRAATILAGAGVPVGVITGTLVGSTDLLALTAGSAVGLAATAGLVAFQGASGSLRSFHLMNLALWSGVYAGSLATMMLTGVETPIAPAILAAIWCVRSWFASGVLGSAAVIAVRRARRHEGSDSDAPALLAAAPPEEGRWARIARRLRDAIRRPLSLSLAPATFDHRRITMNIVRLVVTGTAVVLVGGCGDGRGPAGPDDAALAAVDRPTRTSESAARRIEASGQFAANVDFSTLTLTPRGRNCRLVVDGQLVFTGTIVGVARGTTSALVFAPCDQVAMTPPGTFRDVFRSELVFEGTVDGEPARAKLLYLGGVQPGGQIDGRLVFSRGDIRGRLQADAVVAVGGTYNGSVVVR